MAQKLPANAGEEPGGFFCPWSRKESDVTQHTCCSFLLPSLVAQMVKNLLAMQETWVRSLGQEDPLGKGMATHSSILASKIPLDRGTWWAAVFGVAKSWKRPSN